MIKRASSTRAQLFLLVAIVGLSARPSLAGEVCVQTDVGTFRLSGLPKTKPKSIVGKISDIDVPFSGAGYKRSDGTRVIGFTENYDWGSGNWLDPVCDTVIKLPAIGAGTYDSTCHGVSTPPNNFTGVAAIVQCSFVPFSAAHHPNTR